MCTFAWQRTINSLLAFPITASEIAEQLDVPKSAINSILFSMDGIKAYHDDENWPIDLMSWHAWIVIKNHILIEVTQVRLHTRRVKENNCVVMWGVAYSMLLLQLGLLSYSWVFFKWREMIIICKISNTNAMVAMAEFLIL